MKPANQFGSFALPALALLSLANAALLFVHRVMTNGDNLDYLLIAGLVNAGQWFEPFHWRFPVGYPYLLAFLSWLGGGVIGVNPLTVSTAAIYGFKLAGVAMAPLAVWAVYGWTRAVTASATTACMMALLLATTQVWAPVYSILGAEPYFILSVWLALWGWEQTIISANGERAGWLAVACGASLFALVFRQLGLAIPLAAVIALVGLAILDGKKMAWPALFGAGAVGLAGAALMLMNTSHLGQLAGGAAEQQHILAAKWQLVCANAEAYRMTIPHLLLPKVLGDQGILSKVGLAWLGTVLAFLLGALMLAGLWRIFLERRAGLVSGLFVVINIGIILVWPYRDVRFFVPLLPGLWFLVMRGAAWLASIQPHALLFRPGWAMMAILLLAAWQQATAVFAGVKNVRVIHEWRALPAWHPVRYEITGELDFADHLACGMWLGEHTSLDARVFAEKAAFIELSSGRRTQYLGQGLADGELPQARAETHDVYVVEDVFPEIAGYGRAKTAFRDWRSQPNAPLFDPVFRAPRGATVYRLIK